MYLPRIALASLLLGFNLVQATANECLILERLALCIPGEECPDEVDFECEGSDGITTPLLLEPSQKESMINLVEQGSVVSGQSMLSYTDDMVDESGIHVATGNMIIDKYSEGARKLADRKLAMLPPLTGDVYFLVVKVTDVNNAAWADSTALMSDNIFGSNGDPVNMKSQVFDCSAGQLRIHAGLPDSASATHKAAVDAATTGSGNPVGVMEVTINVAYTDSGMRNAVTAEVNSILGFSLPGSFTHVMYTIDAGSFGWAAYAYINSWNQVYQGRYYGLPGVQIHEYGHNLGLAHSGVGSSTYADHTCLMGNPLYSDDVGKMCFNAGKNFYLNWYDRVVVDPLVAPWQGLVMGVGDWQDYPGAHTAVIKIETGNNDDYFVGFNRASGANSQNDEFDDAVTVTRTGNNGLSYSQSWREYAYQTGAGNTWTVANFRGSGQPLTLTVNSIDLSVTPGVADICISLGACPSDTPPPTTASPTSAPPTTAPPTTASPTPAPPTTAPTAAPTTAPTPSPDGGGFNGDPIILGLQKQVFKFEGRDGGWYSNLSSKYLKWNMQFREFNSCPSDENMFVSGLSLLVAEDNGIESKILIITTPEATEECRSDPNAVCLGDGTLHISLDGGNTFVSTPGDYHSNTVNRVVAHNTYAPCSRKWHDYEVSQNDWRNLRNGGRRATIQEKKPLQLLKDRKSTMIDKDICEGWIEARGANDDLFKQRGQWSTLYIETPLVSFHVEYRRSDWFDPKCDFQSLDAWMTKVSDKMEKTEWSGILGETKYKVFDRSTGEQILTDRNQLLRGKEDADYEVGGPFKTEFKAASMTGEAVSTA